MSCALQDIITKALRIAGAVSKFVVVVVAVAVVVVIVAVVVVVVVGGGGVVVRFENSTIYRRAGVAL